MSEKDNNSSVPEQPAVFYGINLSLPEGQRRPEGVPQFCTSIQEVQTVVKSNKTARFKSFASQAQAEAFSAQAADPLEAVSSPPAPVASAEKSSPYKAPSRPEVQTFRALVERGDAPAVAAAVARNPRHLVNSGDKPAILREGPRHNALHLAALHGRADMCRRLLALAADPALFRDIYPDDEPQVAASRADYMVDLYLNMPTKGTFETPLHLAAKLGHVAVARELVQHAACKRDVRNKFGETPEQVICKKCTGPESGAASQQLTFLLQEPFYVQVLADADGCAPPVLAPPCSPQQRSSPAATSPAPDSPVRSPLRPRAWAGPMPRQLADEFHRRWRSPLADSPLRSRTSSVDDVRLTDAGKGWERVGRGLATQLSVEWREFWPFLDRHLDMSSEAGLQALEAHLHKENCKMVDTTSALQEVSRRLEVTSPPRAVTSAVTPAAPARRPRASPLSPVSALCRDLHELRLDGDDEPLQADPPLPQRRGRLRELMRVRQYSEPLPAELDSDASCEEEEEFYTPPSSSGSVSPATPGEAPEVFIYGRQPTTADLDVLRAIESVKVEPGVYPNICNWRSQVVVRSRSQGFRFMTPRRPTCRPPSVPEGDGSPLRRPTASPLSRLRAVNGHL